ncbi:MAG: TetR family transcriptional regulator [Flavobacteriaceae bacterium]|nr:MAG: TetR family transcriptional regulator [Flavobacteriaceae bacterium]
MKNLYIQIQIGPELYSKDPNSSALGQKIISNSITLIHEIGFEDFTFRKLGKHIQSNESSIYRYFENKHSLLVYLTSWYWSWIEYRLVFATTNIASPTERLKKSILIITQQVKEDNSFGYINEVLLSEIIFSESVKAYHTKNVDEENNRGCFMAYVGVVQRLSNIVLEIKPSFKFPHMLISTVIEGAHQQNYFGKHLPKLTDKGKDSEAITEFYSEMVFNFLKK